MTKYMPWGVEDKSAYCFKCQGWHELPTHFGVNTAGANPMPIDVPMPNNTGANQIRDLPYVLHIAGFDFVNVKEVGQ